MRPDRLRASMFDFSNSAGPEKPKGTPIWRLLMDPYIAVCAGALAMVRKANNRIFLPLNFMYRQMLV